MLEKGSPDVMTVMGMQSFLQDSLKYREISSEYLQGPVLHSALTLFSLISCTMKYRIQLHRLGVTPKQKGLTASTLRDKTVIQRHFDKLRKWLGVNKSKINRCSQKQSSYKVQDAF